MTKRERSGPKKRRAAASALPEPAAAESGRLSVQPPEEEFRLLVEARMETLAKLARQSEAPDATGSTSVRLDLYARALERGLELLRGARPR